MQIHLINLHLHGVAGRDLVAAQAPHQPAALRHEPIVVVRHAEPLDEPLDAQPHNVDHRADVPHLGHHPGVGLRLATVDLALQMGQQLDQYAVELRVGGISLG